MEKEKRKMSLKERLEQQREDLKRQGPGKFIKAKEGITRVRILPTGKEKEWGMEVTYFYLGMKSTYDVISPATFGEKCAIMNAYNELSKSKSEGDRKFAAKFKPQRRFMAAVIKSKNDKVMDVDTEVGVKLLLMSGGIYQSAIDLWLDNDNGDFTDPINGYDLKIKRVGKTKNDTEYNLLAGKVSKLPREYRGEIDLEKMIREIVPTFKETRAIRDEFLNLPQEEGDDEDEAPKKKKKKKRDL